MQVPLSTRVGTRRRRKKKEKIKLTAVSFSLLEKTLISEADSSLVLAVSSRKEAHSGQEGFSITHYSLPPRVNFLL